MKCSASSRVRVDLADSFLARERLSRLEGLVLFFVCILKVFIYDMRKLETMYSILSITALGALLPGFICTSEPGSTSGFPLVLPTGKRPQHPCAYFHLKNLKRNGSFPVALEKFCLRASYGSYLAPVMASLNHCKDGTSVSGCGA